MNETISRAEFLKASCLTAAGFGLCGFRVFGAADVPGKWSTPARFVTTEGDAIRCHKCPHGCLIQRGETGRCLNRVNYEGALYSIAYGNPCAVHIDPIEKKPFYHFLPTTRAFSIAVAGCNFSCLNCQNWQISQTSPRATENDDMMPARVVEECFKNRCECIAYTYSEPTTFYEYAYDTAVRAKQRGIHNLWKSNGFINEVPLRGLCRVIDAANIDLKCYDAEVYRRLTGGALDPVLRTLKVLHEEGVWLEITNLVIPSWSDDMDSITRMCDWLVASGLEDCPLHFSRFAPLYKLAHLSATPVATLEQAHAIARAAGMHYVYVGNVPGHDAENTYCHHCGERVLERRGFTIRANLLKEGKCSSCKTVIPGRWR
jgi:pyruvate formate lyase activating enzyme